MNIKEVVRKSQTYIATIRVVFDDGSTTARTTIRADTIQQTRTILSHIFGEDNVLNITQVMSENEDMTEGTKTLSPQELQVKSLADKAEDYKQQAKAMKARQQMAKAQQDLMKAQQGR